MGDRVKIGARVDEDLWREFRNDVERRKGQTRGVLGDELETAIRQYLYTGEQRDEAVILREIEERLGRVESAVDPPSADGGPSASEREETHTHSGPPDVRAPKIDRAEWLLDNELDVTPSSTVPRAAVETVISRTWGLSDEAADDLVEVVLEQSDLVVHPTDSSLFVGPERYDEIEAADREAALADADETFADLDDAETE